MMFIKKICVFCMLLLTMTNAIAQPVIQETSTDASLINDFARNYYMQFPGLVLPEKWNKTLYDAMEGWLGTPYCYAGNSKNGVDCSGFVTSLYNRVYQTALGARNSADIYKKITKVDTGELTEGDLVFFRIHKRRVTHVGLYLCNGKFVHASTTNGVIISDLADPYYKKFYAGGGRLPSVLETNEVTP